MSDDDQHAAPRLEVGVAASPEAAWRALRQRDVLEQWHGWDYPELDAEIETIYFTNHFEGEDRRRLVVNGGDQFELVPSRDGVRIVIARAPLSGDVQWDAHYGIITEGWISFLQQLRFLLEREPAGSRRTLYYSAPAPSNPIVALQLEEVAGLPPGSRYEAQLAGEAVGGEVWYRTSNQLGLTVDSWGEGLLVLQAPPGSEAAHLGTPAAIVSTFGQDQRALDRLDERWQQHWSSAPGA